MNKMNKNVENMEIANQNSQNISSTSCQIFFSIIVAICGGLSFGHDLTCLNTAAFPIKCWLYVMKNKESNLDLSYQDFCIKNTNNITSDFEGFSEIVSEWALVSSLPNAGAFIAAGTAFIVIESLGRLKSIILFFIFEAISVLLCFTARYSQNLMQFIIGRLLVGIGFGGISVVLPIWIQEVAPKEEYRNNFGTIFFISWNFGIAFSQVIGIPNIFGTAENWQFCVGFSLIYLTIGLISTFFAVDSSIRPLPGQKFGQIISNFSRDFKNIIFNDKPTLKTIILLATTFGLCNWTGTVPLITYSSEIYKKAGLNQTEAGFVSMGLNISNVTATLLLGCIINRLNLKSQILRCILVQALASFTIAIFTGSPSLNQITALQYAAIILTYISLFASDFGSYPIPVMLPVEYLDETDGKRGLAASLVTSWPKNVDIKNKILESFSGRIC